MSDKNKPLEPCPYCGRDEAMLEHETSLDTNGDFIESFFVLCRACGSCSFWFPEVDPAKDEWNREAKKLRERRRRNAEDIHQALDEAERSMLGGCHGIYEDM